MLTAKLIDLPYIPFLNTLLVWGWSSLVLRGEHRSALLPSHLRDPIISLVEGALLIHITFVHLDSVCLYRWCVICNGLGRSSLRIVVNEGTFESEQWALCFIEEGNAIQIVIPFSLFSCCLFTVLELSHSPPSCSPGSALPKGQKNLSINKNSLCVHSAL